MNSEKKLSAALDGAETEAKSEAKSEAESDAADDSALSGAEQDRFRRMLEDAEARIEALDKHLTESGIIRREADEANNQAGNQTGNMPENVAENTPGEKTEKTPAGDAPYRQYDDTRAEADPAEELPMSPPVADMPLRSAPWQLLAGFGISFAVRVGILGIWLGSYIDRRWLGDTGIGAMAIIVLVIFYSFYMLYRDLMRLSSPDTPDTEAAGKKTADD